MNELKIMNISGVSCYEKDGTAYLNLEAVARGLGFTRTAASGNEVVMWSRVESYLQDLGVHTCAHDGFIPENIFYRLAMKAKNETAEKFQALVADEIIPFKMIYEILTKLENAGTIDIVRDPALTAAGKKRTFWEEKSGQTVIVRRRT